MQRQGGPATCNFYSQWRISRRDDTVREQRPSPPPEALMQTIWQHQRLQRDALTTVDGRPVRVLHPGFVITRPDRISAGPWCALVRQRT